MQILFAIYASFAANSGCQVYYPDVAKLDPQFLVIGWQREGSGEAKKFLEFSVVTDQGKKV